MTELLQVRFRPINTGFSINSLARQNIVDRKVLLCRIGLGNGLLNPLTTPIYE
jgi:hypothetical protein